MWVKLLKDIHFEGGRVITARSVVYLRRAGQISESRHTGEFRQIHSVMTLEDRDHELILVLPDAEGALWEPAEEPK